MIKSNIMHHLANFSIITIGLSAFMRPTPAMADGFGGSFPVYLLTDAWFWLFLTASVILVGGASLLPLAFVQGSPSRDRSVALTLGRLATAALLVALVYQVFHFAEHVAQIFQHWYLGKPPKESLGILWFAGVEWNHFLFNVGYYGLELIFTIGMLNAFQRFHVRPHPVGLMLLLGYIAFQGWHFVEHTVRIVEHIVIGCEPCPGVLDRLTGWKLITLHFWLNAIALGVTSATVVWFGLHMRFIPERVRMRVERTCLRYLAPSLCTLSALVVFALAAGR